MQTEEIKALRKEGEDLKTENQQLHGIKLEHNRLEIEVGRLRLALESVTKERDDLKAKLREQE